MSPISPLRARRPATLNRYFKFASTSKVTFPGAGIATVAASAENIAEIKARVGVQTVGYDKMNQLRHVRFLKDATGVDAPHEKARRHHSPKIRISGAYA